MAANKKRAVQEIKKDQTYTLDQLLASKRFSNRKDMLKAVLSGFGRCFPVGKGDCHYAPCNGLGSRGKGH